MIFVSCHVFFREYPICHFLTHPTPGANYSACASTTFSSVCNDFDRIRCQLFDKFKTSLFFFLQHACYWSNLMMVRESLTWVQTVGVRVPLGTVPTHVRKVTIPECSPTRKKAGVCAIMSMWLVHIKEHVWTVRTCPTTIFLSDCRIVGGAVRWMHKHCEFPQVVALKKKCGYSCHVTCMLHGELIWEEVAPSHNF